MIYKVAKKMSIDNAIDSSGAGSDGIVSLIQGKVTL